jgi:hypothetical protein
MIKELIKLSNHLDAKGLRKEADYLDAVIKAAGNKANDKGNWFHQVAAQGGALGQAVMAQGFRYQSRGYNSAKQTLSYEYIQKQEDGSVARVTLTYDSYTPPNQQVQDNGQEK